MSQLKFNDHLCRIKCGLPLPYPDTNRGMPFVSFNGIQGETPALSIWDNEPGRRRSDVGRQVYGSGTPTLGTTNADRFGLSENTGGTQYTVVPTSHGNLKLSSNYKDRGFMPTGDTIDFLRTQYLGSRQPDLPGRYYR